MPLTVFFCESEITLPVFAQIKFQVWISINAKNVCTMGEQKTQSLFAEKYGECGEISRNFWEQRPTRASYQLPLKQKHLIPFTDADHNRPPSCALHRSNFCLSSLGTHHPKSKKTCAQDPKKKMPHPPPLRVFFHENCLVHDTKGRQSWLSRMLHCPIRLKSKPRLPKDRCK